MCFAIPAKVISIKDKKAEVDFLGKKQFFNTQLVKIKVGDYVLISNGFIIKKIKSEEAKEIFKIIKE